jgi:hypothetical protein
MPVRIIPGANVPNGRQDVSIATPSAAAGARTIYSVSFNVSATGALSGTANSAVTLTLPVGTGFAGYGSGSITDDSTGLQVGTCRGAVGLTVTCPLSAGAQVHAAAPVGDRLTIVLPGITNTLNRTGLIAMSTTSQPRAMGIGSVTTLPPNQVSTPTVAVANPKQNATTSYAINFQTSWSGGLAGAAYSAVNLTFPQGTGFEDLNSTSVVDETTGAQVGTCGGAQAEVVVCRLAGGATVNGGNPPPRATPGDAIGIVLTGVRNPNASGTYDVSVSTTSDVKTVASTGYTVG